MLESHPIFAQEFAPILKNIIDDRSEYSCLDANYMNYSLPMRKQISERALRSNRGQGIYFGGIMAYNAFGGDFNGETVFGGNEAFVLLPDIEGAFGYGAAIGLMSDVAIWDIFFSISRHRADMREINYSTDVRFSMVGMNFGFKFLRQPYFHPYILAGIGVGGIEIDSSAAYYDVYNSEYFVAESEYSNYLIHAGLGAVWYLGSWLGLRSELYYRYFAFKSVTLSMGGEYDLENKVGASGINVALYLIAIIRR